jgi:cytochrome c553
MRLASCIFTSVLLAIPLASMENEMQNPNVSVRAQVKNTASPAQTPSIATAFEAPSQNQNPALPSWAFTPPTPRVNRAYDDTVLHVSNSTLGYTKAQITDLYGPPDWFPKSHPPAPKVVLEGRKPVVTACGYCHLPNGFGRPENESIAGLPADYILEQLEDFKNDRRHSSVPMMATILMIPIAKWATQEEMKEAANYFSSVKPMKWIRVVETNTVPKTHASARMWVADEAGATEPIGQRVIEVSEKFELTEMRDSASGFIAYVPVGALKKGEALVKTGGKGKTTPCTMCHGQNLKGLGNIPSIAGR